MAPCPLLSHEHTPAAAPTNNLKGKQPGMAHFGWFQSGLGGFQHGVGWDNMETLVFLDFTPIFLDFTPVFRGFTLIGDLKMELFVPTSDRELRNRRCRSRFEITKISQNPLFSSVLSLFSPGFIPSTTQGWISGCSSCNLGPCSLASVLPPLIPLCSSPGKAPLICWISGVFYHKKVIFLFSPLSSFPSSLPPPPFRPHLL